MWLDALLNDKNIVSYFALWLRVYEMHVFVFQGLNSSPSRFSPYQFHSNTKTKHLERLLESFFFLAAAIPIFFACYFFDHPEEPWKPAEHLSIFAANSQEINIFVSVFISERSCLYKIPQKEL